MAQPPARHHWQAAHRALLSLKKQVSYSLSVWDRHCQAEMGKFCFCLQEVKNQGWARPVDSKGSGSVPPLSSQELTRPPATAATSQLYRTQQGGRLPSTSIFSSVQWAYSHCLFFIVHGIGTRVLQQGLAPLPSQSQLTLEKRELTKQSLTDSA